MNMVEETPARNGRRKSGAAAAQRAPAATGAATAEWCVGFVEDSPAVAPGAGASLRVRSGALLMNAQAAASCLLQPEVGDTVAGVRVAADGFWIMAVLQRESTQPRVLQFDGPTRLLVRQGGLDIQADAVGMRTGSFALEAQTANVIAQEADFAGRQLRVAASAFKLVGGVLSTVFERVQHFSQHYLRTTQGIDRVNAENLELEARQLAKLSGEHVLANGRKLFKARSAQVHLG